jgi:ABC-type transport system substrate-binding protein
LLSALLGISACSEPEPSVIRMGLATAPLNLDPRYATDATSERVNRLLYQRLVEFDRQGRPIPGVAEILFPPEHWAGHPHLIPYRHDPTRARSLLRAAGYTEVEPLRLVYKTSSDPFRIRLATIIQSHLPYVPLWFENQYAIQGPGVVGFRLSPDGNYDGLRSMQLKDSRRSSDVATTAAH